MRIAALVVIAACSSSKPAEKAPPPAPAPAAAPAQGSAEDTWAPKPADPAAEAAQLRADIAVMCGAAKATGGKVFMDVGPYIAENMQGPFKVELFADVRNRTLDELIERMRKGMAKAGVTQCDTVDVLIANDPRKKQ